MARRGALAQDALVALGPEKLAKLVLDETVRNASFKRIVTAALASARGADAVAGIIDRRLAALERARGFIDWDKRKAFVVDLQATVATITNELAPADPTAAVERLLRFVAHADGVLERVDDSSGQVQEVYRAAVETLPPLVEKLDHEEKSIFSDRLVPMLLSDGYGLIEQLLSAVLPVLTEAAVARLDAALVQAAQVSSSGRSERDWEARARRDRIIRSRQALADHRKDVDAFIALENEGEAQRPDTFGVAERLLAAGRASEALEWIRRPARPGLRILGWQDLGEDTMDRDIADLQRKRLETRILEAAGDAAAAQALRWQTFEDTLDVEMLRDYLSHLPDFAEFEVLDRAFAHAAAHARRYSALAFFLAWPRLDLAATLVLDHRETWEGRHYGALLPAAEAMEESDPEAATVLYRALIEDVLTRARSRAYGHAARYFTKLEALAERIEASSDLADHARYKDTLKKAHGRKSAFWSLLSK